MSRRTTFHADREVEELPAEIDGRAVLIDGAVKLAGDIWPGCRQTWTSPEELPTVDIGIVSVSVSAATDAATLDAIDLTPELRAVGERTIRAWIEAHEDELSREILEDADERAAAAMDAAIDRRIDERRERGFCR